MAKAVSGLYKATHWLHSDCWHRMHVRFVRDAAMHMVHVVLVPGSTESS